METKVVPCADGSDIPKTIVVDGTTYEQVEPAPNTCEENWSFMEGL